MSSIGRRIEQAERAVGIDEPVITIIVTDFSGLPLPPEERRGNIITKFVAYEPPQERSEGADRP